jgi:hypothetical protein
MRSSATPPGSGRPREELAREQLLADSPWVERQAITRRGSPYPLGANVHPAGVNFSVFSKGSTRVELMLFDGVDDATATRGTSTRCSAKSMASWCISGAPWIRKGKPSMSWCRSGATPRQRNVSSEGY